jgi:3',5'-cyclic-AMP phosphodiesterase
LIILNRFYYCQTYSFAPSVYLAVYLAVYLVGTYPMRVAHISDLHLRHHLPGESENPARLSRLMPEYFAQAIAQINELAPDLLVLSGDLVDYPLDLLDDPTTQAQGWQDLLIVAESLKRLHCPLSLVYGNHDHPRLTAELFAHVPNDQTCAGFRVLSFNDEEDDNKTPRRIGTERAHFLAALAEGGPNATPQIHVQHYVVWPERNEGYAHTYAEGEWMLEQLIASGNARLVLSGHYHVGVPLFSEKGVYFCTIPAFSEAPHPFHLYNLVDGEVFVESYSLDR